MGAGVKWKMRKNKTSNVFDPSGNEGETVAK